MILPCESSDWAPRVHDETLRTAAGMRNAVCYNETAPPAARTFLIPWRPAQHDVFALGARDHYLAGNWPYLIQGLEMAEASMERLKQDLQGICQKIESVVERL